MSTLLVKDEKILYLCSLVLDFIPDVPRFIRLFTVGKAVGSQAATKITNT